jgi:hypothetical protein
MLLENEHMDFKPEVAQSLRWSFAIQVGRTFSLRTEDVLRLLEMLKNYDKDRSEELGQGPCAECGAPHPTSCACG